MYKIFNNNLCAPPGCINKILRVMKITVILLIATIMQVSATGFAQKVTLNKKNITLSQVFDEMRRQTGYDVLYGSAVLKGSTKINATFNNSTIQEVMKKCLEGKALTFDIEEKTIVVKEKTPSFLDFPKPAFANIDARGKILDESGKALEGATIVVKGTSRTTKTDAKGEFVMTNVPDDGVLVVRYVGYRELEVSLKDAVMPLEIKLNVATGELEEVNVTYSTGYQNIPKERATGSFSIVDNQLLNRQVSTSILDRLRGNAVGLAFNRNDRDGDEISIRGRSTIFSNAEPLIVVDNFPYEGLIDNINPNDIESVTILKDAAAASIWGTRAGNGVIVIKTKSGGYNSKTGVDFNVNASIGAKPDLFYLPKMTSSEIIDVEQYLFGKGFYNSNISNTSTFPALSPVVEILLKQRNGQIAVDVATQLIDEFRNKDSRNDLLKYSYHPGITQRYALNLNGGTEKSTYYISGGYDHDISSLKDDSKRMTASVKNSFTLTKKLKADIDIVYTQGLNKQGKFPAGGSQFPYEMLTDENGNGLSVTSRFRNSFVSNAENRGFLSWINNPVEDAKLNDKTAKRTELRLMAGLSYDILDGLSLSAFYQFQQQGIKNRTFQNANSYYTRNLINTFSTIDPVTTNVIDRPIPLGGILETRTDESVAHNGRMQLSFNRVWKKHQISAIGGIEVRQVESSSDAATLYGYDEETSIAKNVNFNTLYLNYPSGVRLNIPSLLSSGSGNLDRFRSVYFNAAYTYLDRYTLTASARKDASNYFGVSANQRAIPLWSAGLKLDVDKEPFYNLQWLPNLKLRSTYGYNGNINKSVNALTVIQYQAANFFNVPSAVIINPPNPDLRWERVGVLNLGLDFGLKGNVVSGSIEYYRKNSKDLIGDAPIDGTTGVIGLTDGTGKYRGNVASLRAEGVDVALNIKSFDRDFKWTTNVLFSYNAEKVTKYNFKPSVGSIFTQGIISPIEGKPVFSIFSYKWAGLDPSTGDPQGLANGQVSKDYALLTNPAIDGLVYNGNGRPPYYGSIRNTFSYKGFSLTGNILFKFGYYYRSNGLRYTALFSNLSSHSDYSQRWQSPGDEQNTNVPSLLYPANNSRDSFYALSEVLVEKADHIRLQDIGLSYSFKAINLKKLGIQSLSVYSYANNLGLLWKASKDAGDPDYINIYPAVKTYSFGIRASL